MLIPNGGERDVTPPRVVKYMPDSAAVNFRSGEINLFFNEYIQLKDVNNQLIVSPPLEEPPVIKLLKYKILNIKFSKPLKENTTYTLSFGNSIADYNEGNVLEGFQYVFSTGSFIDSLSIGGKIQNAFDHKTEKGILVMLYDAEALKGDSVPYKELPSYFTRTKPDGSYKITNLRAGKYRIFALKDENKNYKYDAEAEWIGFSDKLVEPGSKANCDMELCKEIPGKIKLKSVVAAGYGHLLFAFNKPVANLSIDPLNIKKVPTEIVEYSKNKDSLNYWFAGVPNDSLILQLTDNNVVIDTCRVRLITKEHALKSPKGEKLKLAVSSNTVSGQKFDLNKDLQLKFNNPLKEFKAFRFDSIKKLISDTSRFEHHSVDLLWHNDKRTLYFNSHIFCHELKINNLTGVTDTVFWGYSGIWNEEHTYTYLFLPGAFTDIFENVNDTFKIEFKTQELKFYGTLKLKFSLPQEGNYVLQFLDGKDGVVKEDVLKSSKTFNYEYIPPGSYKLKLIYDTNGNGKWDSGNFLGKVQPEKVVYYDLPIVVRSNWDMEIEWKP